LRRRNANPALVMSLLGTFGAKHPHLPEEDWHYDDGV
jgi:hypothetical protein